MVPDGSFKIQCSRDASTFLVLAQNNVEISPDSKSY